MTFRTWLCAVLVSSLYACSGTSSGTSTPPPAPSEDRDGGDDGANPNDAGPSVTDGAVGECKGLTPSGAAITLAPVSGGADPTPTGGTIADGTYQLTAVNVYNGPAEAATVRLKATLTIDGARWTRAFSFQVQVGAAAGDESVGSDSGTFTTVGTTVAGVTTCTDGESDNGFGAFSGGFSVDGSTLTLIQAPPSGIQGATKIAYVLTKA